jgi:hypothetical protein
MPRVGQLGEGLWVPGPDDADALFGAFAQNPLVAAIALLLVGVVLLISRTGAGTFLNVGTASPPPQIRVTSFPRLSREPAVWIHAVNAKRTPRSTGNRGQPGNEIHDYGDVQRFGLSAALGRQLEQSPVGLRSKVNLGRGPPERFAVNHLAGSRLRTHRGYRRRAQRYIRGRVR